MANFVIQTRQKNDVLFPIPPAPATVAPPVGLATPFLVPDPSAVPVGLVPLEGSAFRSSGPVEVAGYAAIIVLIVSDQPFTVTFFEAVLPDGPFVLSQTFAAAASGSLFVVSQKFAPVGSYMTMTLTNNSTAPETELGLLVQGVPAP